MVEKHPGPCHRAFIADPVLSENFTPNKDALTKDLRRHSFVKPAPYQRFTQY